MHNQHRDSRTNGMYLSQASIVILRAHIKGLINAIKKLRTENKQLHCQLQEARQQIRELNERIVELEDIDYLPSEDDNLLHEGE